MADKIIEIARGDVDLGADTAAWSPLLWSLIWRTMRLGLERDPVTALRELPKLRQLAVRHGNDEMVLWTGITYETELLLRAGSGDDLRRLANDCGQVLSRIDAGINLHLMAMSLLASAVNAVELKWDAALADANEAQRRSDAHGAHPFEAGVFESIARAHLALGNSAASRAAAAEGIRRMQQSGSIYRPGVYAVKARAQLALHEPAADIKATLDEYASLLERTGIRLFEVDLYEIRAELAAREGWSDEREKALQGAWAVYAQMGLTTRADAIRAALDSAGMTR